MCLRMVSLRCVPVGGRSLVRTRNHASEVRFRNIRKKNVGNGRWKEKVYSEHQRIRLPRHTGSRFEFMESKSHSFDNKEQGCCFCVSKRTVAWTCVVVGDFWLYLRNPVQAPPRH
jgi:hypothetical protein